MELACSEPVMSVCVEVYAHLCVGEMGPVAECPLLQGPCIAKSHTTHIQHLP